jgi:hypothetical protein
MNKTTTMLSLSFLLSASYLPGAMAQTINPERIQPQGPMPPTPENRTGLPPAPPEIIRGPGSVSRGFTGNDTPDPTTPPPTRPDTAPGAAAVDDAIMARGLVELRRLIAADRKR